MTQANHERFVARSVSGGRVWRLTDTDGNSARCDSNEQDTIVVMFWSDSALAKRAASANFADHQPAEVNLIEFVCGWLEGMSEDNVLVGANWTADLVGLECDPKTLASELKAKMTADQLRQCKHYIRPS